MGVRPDVRLETAPMTPVACGSCGARVEVRKSSWDQTSIQWHDDAVATCLERRASTPAPGVNGDTFPGCEALRQAIREAAVSGVVQVVSGEPLKSNPDAPEAEQAQVSTA